MERIMDRISVVKQLFDSLSEDEQTALLAQIVKEFKSATSPDKPGQSAAGVVNSRPQPECRRCVHCGSDEIVKSGKNGNGTQRYKCKHCGKLFTATRLSVTFNSKKPPEVWRKYCECFLDKLSLRRCAEICDINLETAFNWRHKILDALSKKQRELVLTGVVESDETFLPVSYKGCRHLRERHDREPRMRGGIRCKRGHSREQVCVSCSVNHNRQAGGAVTNLGHPSLADLAAVLNGRVASGAMLVTDGNPSYARIAAENDLTHIKIPRRQHKSGNFNIQTVNNCHSQLKEMIKHRFKGVATKYLNNYVAYSNLVNIAAGSATEKQAGLEAMIFNTPCVTPGYLISSREAIPLPRRQGEPTVNKATGP